MDNTGKLKEPAVFPLAEMIHLYLSGGTGAGKSFLARVLIEEAAQHQQLNILVVDPRNQSVGLLVPEDRPKILERFADFDMNPKNAHGYGFNYFAPGLPYAATLPSDLSQLGKGRSIVSLKGLDEARRCRVAGNILNAVFEANSTAESEGPRLLIVIDEAQNFTRRRVEHEAKDAASTVERAMDRITREGRKFGIVLALVSQSMKDFGYELVSIRQMTTSKIFMRNGDAEIAFANDILGDGRQLVQLATGMAIFHHANQRGAQPNSRQALQKLLRDLKPLEIPMMPPELLSGTNWKITARMNAFSGARLCHIA